MKVLIVIDMQNDFIYGSLGTPEAVKVVPKVLEKVRSYHQNGNRIIFTQDTHYSKTYPYTQEGQKLPVEHCIFNTSGWELAKELQIYANKENTVIKNAFAYNNWEGVGLDENVEQIEIAGLCTDICVVSNALFLKALFPEIPIAVDPACCAGTSPAMHAKALDVMKSCQIEI